MAEQHLHLGHEGAWLLLDHLITVYPRLAKSEEFWMTLHDNGLVGSKLYTYFLTDCAASVTTFCDHMESLLVRTFYAAPEKPPLAQKERTPSPTSVVEAHAEDAAWVYATP